MTPDVLMRRLERSKQRVAVLEGMIEDATRALFLSNQELQENVLYLEKLQAMLPTAVVIVTEELTIRHCNPAATALLSQEAESLQGVPITEIWKDAPSTLHGISQMEAEWLSSDGGAVSVLVSAASADDDATRGDIVIVATDLRERKRLEVELRHAHKLESVGQLAAGIAHEINTPMQFVGDNVDFIKEACETLLGLVKESAAIAGPGVAAQIEEAHEEADLDFLTTRLPKSLKRTVDGIERVTTIVAAMKAFSHPGKAMAPADLNEALETTLTVATNEYRYVADVVTEFGEMPLVHCTLGDVSQVFLNLIVNAAHAIEEKRQGDGRGVIHVSTRTADGVAEVRITDDGGGIPESARERIFEPFFTTKTVGKGTGQGLSLAHTIVTERHGGTLTFETETGKGTTFIVRIPVGATAEQAA